MPTKCSSVRSTTTRACWSRTSEDSFDSNKTSTTFSKNSATRQRNWSPSRASSLNHRPPKRRASWTCSKDSSTKPSILTMTSSPSTNPSRGKSKSSAKTNLTRRKPSRRSPTKFRNLILLFLARRGKSVIRKVSFRPTNSRSWRWSCRTRAKPDSSERRLEQAEST
jgi:hypothetical protein